MILDRRLHNLQPNNPVMIQCEALHQNMGNTSETMSDQVEPQE